ncbi:hypothetical protein LK07_03820 [Streptomyces pluripotens]|uniref:Uncharacterized protein n=1 Tax=Streptomyces pluripotens TaxID=1355015 RepID=A0A221NTL6_9ACTN|nr:MULTISPECIES: hypothetical protein [Streptomyces]ARP69042.1 hypothetical protein LK06_002735 [Streptomyces pluripotens]ASN23301.1 hypothetical protein LK07_03820 [Streptomyces pluripotens]MCH0561252.1 hypothetical protein [Streptomyces sp. MUM 16J]
MSERQTLPQIPQGGLPPEYSAATARPAATALIREFVTALAALDWQEDQLSVPPTALRASAMISETSRAPAPVDLAERYAAPGERPAGPRHGEGLWLVDGHRHGDAAVRVASGVPAAEEQRRAAALVREEDRWRCTAPYVALRMVLGARVGVLPEQVELVREPCPGCGGPGADAQGGASRRDRHRSRPWHGA